MSWKRKEKLDRIMSFVTLLLGPAKSRKPMSTWSVTEESLITAVWLCRSLWCTCRPVEHFRRLLAQKSFTCYAHVCLLFLFLPCQHFATECFDMEVVWPVLHKLPKYSYNYSDIRLQNITADFFSRPTGKDLLIEMSVSALSFVHSLTSLLEKFGII